MLQFFASSYVSFPGAHDASDVIRKHSEDRSGEWGKTKIARAEIRARGARMSGAPRVDRMRHRRQRQRPRGRQPRGARRLASHRGALAVRRAPRRRPLRLAAAAPRAHRGPRSGLGVDGAELGARGPRAVGPPCARTRARADVAIDSGLRVVPELSSRNSAHENQEMQCIRIFLFSRFRSNSGIPFLSCGPHSHEKKSPA